MELIIDVNERFGLLDHISNVLHRAREAGLQSVTYNIILYIYGIIVIKVSIITNN